MVDSGSILRAEPCNCISICCNKWLKLFDESLPDWNKLVKNPVGLAGKCCVTKLKAGCSPDTNFFTLLSQNELNREHPLQHNATYRLMIHFKSSKNLNAITFTWVKDFLPPLQTQTHPSKSSFITRLCYKNFTSLRNRQKNPTRTFLYLKNEDVCVCVCVCATG